MIEHPALSIVIPVFNGATTIERVVAGLQELDIAKDTEIIVVAEDDVAYECEATPVKIDVGATTVRRQEEMRPDRLLFVGWTDNIK
ncbi:MAG: hypothetical protein HON14_09200, partial [Rhodospirillaceae bacterium]|nr:hypothetical protein [Rhodospirillaceae bacterium]